MTIKIVAATALIFGLCQGVALAQSSSSASSTSSKSDHSLPQEISKKLKSQGFTNVQIVPGSYLVSAKDKDGDPVSMVIGPHSMTMITMMGQDSGSSTQQSQAPDKQGSSKQ